MNNPTLNIPVILPQAQKGGIDAKCQTIQTFVGGPIIAYPQVKFADFQRITGSVNVEAIKPAPDRANANLQGMQIEIDRKC